MHPLTVGGWVRYIRYLHTVLVLYTLTLINPHVRTALGTLPTLQYLTRLGWHVRVLPLTYCGSSQYIANLPPATTLDWCCRTYFPIPILLYCTAHPVSSSTTSSSGTSALSKTHSAFSRRRRHQPCPPPLSLTTRPDQTTAAGFTPAP